MAEKRYYWLKLQEDFFSSLRIKKLRRIAGGDTYTIIYLKMQLMAIRNGGILKYCGIEKSFAEELALDMDEEVENVSVTLQYLLACGLIETSDNIEYLLPFAALNTGSEGSGAKRVREFRERQKEVHTPSYIALPKSNAERQRAYRAKQKCAEKQHIPMVDDNVNRTRYGGNYYLVCQREKYKCAICGSIENLCVHHIDGYDESKPENNAMRKMLLLCRKCHSNVHCSDFQIPEDVLDSVGYFDSVTSDDFCNADVTLLKQTGNGEIEKDKEIDKEIEIDPPKSPQGETEAIEIPFSGSLREAFDDWIAYKVEKRQQYKSRGLKSLVTQIQRYAKQFGEEETATAIRNSMASNYQGIVFDRIGKTATANPSSATKRKAKAPEEYKGDDFISYMMEGK